MTKRSSFGPAIPFVLILFFAVSSIPAAAQSVLNFEGLGNLQPIGTIAGATFSPNWLSVNSCTAGGPGNFVNPPSGVGIAFILVGGPGTTGTITFSQPVSSVSTRYAARTSPLTLTAFDAAGNAVGTAIGPQTPFTFTGQCGVSDTWGTLSISSPSGPIASVSIHDAGNFFAIDDFRFSARRPVIVIPGTLGSFLDRADNGQLLWFNGLQMADSVCDELLLPLRLNDDGISPANSFTFHCNPTNVTFFSSGTSMTVDPSSDVVYGKLLIALKTAGFRVEHFPYDWRRDLRINARLLRSTILGLTPNPSDTVDLVVHSQGGLVARTYYQLFPTDHHINRIIYLSTPHLGTTKPYAILNDWIGFETNFGRAFPLVNFQTGHFISTNFPAFYDLLPRYPFVIVKGQFESFQTSFGLNLPSQIPANGPLPNLDLATQANTLWNDTIKDVNLLPSGRSFAINGSGQNTLYLLTVAPECPSGLRPVGDPQGDGTVPQPSASGLAGTRYFYVNEEHSELRNNALVQSKIIEILNTGNASLEAGFQEQPFSLDTITAYTCSPVKMVIFDSSNNTSGLDASGNLRQDIPDSTFLEFPKNEAALLPATDTFRVLLQATDSGTFSLIFNFFDSQNTPIRSVRFVDVPISINSRAQMLLNPTAGSQILQLDVNGDGIADYVIQGNQPPPVASFASVLIDVIGTFKLPKGLFTDLTSVLHTALAALQRGDSTTAHNMFMAFKHKVDAQTGKALTTTQALVLRDLADKAVVLLF